MAKALYLQRSMQESNDYSKRNKFHEIKMFKRHARKLYHEYKM